jgi:tetratricopeptide (TPR) repeat protein
MTARMKKPRLYTAAAVILSFSGASAPLGAAPLEKPTINVTAYSIDAALDPATHMLNAQARVTFTALSNLDAAVFELHGALRVTSVTDGSGQSLNGERGANATVRVTPTQPLMQGQSYTYTFSYNGQLNDAEGGPVEGLKLASIADPVSYLLYAARWFPMVGYQTDRFTADIHVHVPAGYTVIGSGSTLDAQTPVAASDDDGTTLKIIAKPRPASAQAAAPKATTPAARARAARAAKAAAANSTPTTSATPANAAAAAPANPNAALPSLSGGKEFDFSWQKPGFPGTIIVGKYNPAFTNPGSPNIKVYTLDDKKLAAPEYTSTANRVFAFYTSTFGLPESSHLSVVELPDDTVAAYWAPEIAAVSGSRIGNKTDYRLLSNTIAHQWWGSEISPATMNDEWLTNGMSRYSELLYLEDISGQAALQQAVQDVAAGALAYDTIPLTSAGRLAAFSPEFQTMTLEKGATVFHMLRWEVGDDSFLKIMRATLTQYKDKPITTRDFERLADAESQEQLTAFFAQWLDGTGAPEFKNKYSVYRLGNNKGFRTIGEIDQDLDLFRMPVELKVETDGKTEDKRIDVVGTSSQYVVDTFGRPRHIQLDPNGWLLKNTPDTQVRVAILRGQQLVAQGDLGGGLAEYQKALQANPATSLASYRIGEVLFTQRNYQASANAYRDALRGDDDPRWTEVWSHVQLGKIFDLTGQRDRAVNEYRQAVQTNDNTQGALNEARLYLKTPFKRDDAD